MTLSVIYKVYSENKVTINIKKIEYQSCYGLYTEKIRSRTETENKESKLIKILTKSF